MEIKTTILWILILAMTGPTLYFGYTKVAGQQLVTANFRRWGYSVLFMKALGTVEIAAALALLFPFTRIWAIAAMAIILIGAVATHLRAGDSSKDTLTPVWVFVHLSIIFSLVWF